MRLNQFESEEERRSTPWRRHAPPVNKKPSDPNYPSGKFDPAEWNKHATQHPKKQRPVDEEVNEIPEVGDTIRTKKMQMEGKVEALGKARAGYDEVTFRIADGRLMKTPLSNVIVVTKLADCDSPMMEDRVDEISNEVLTKYKTAAGKDASAADKAGNIERGNKRFSGIVKATNKQFDNDKKKTKTEEGSMGGINRSAPAVDVSYEKVLDEVKALWEKEKLDELSVKTLQQYRDAAGSPDVAKTEPLRKVVKHSRGVTQADQKIKTKIGDRTGSAADGRGNG